MNERASLKRSTPAPSYENCIICQKFKRDTLYKASTQGLNSLRQSAEERRKCRDVDNTDKIDKIVNALETENQEKLHWHKSCFAVFTDKGKISRLKAALRSSSLAETQLTTSAGLRSRTATCDWKLCLFCQKEERKKETLCSVTTFRVSQQIIEEAKFDHNLSVRVAGVSDLMAAEGKYHPNCYKKFLRDVSRSRGERSDKTVTLVWLINDLKRAAAKGHILELNEVFHRYCSLAAESSIEVPASFRSRISTFKEHIEPHISDIYEFIKMKNEDITERKTVLVPTKFLHIPVSQLLSRGTDADNDDECPIPTFKTDEQDDFLSMVHVALMLRSDILNHPAHTGLSVSEEDAIACVPERLYMFIKLLLGGHALLESDAESTKNVTDDEMEYSDDEGECDTDTGVAERRNGEQLVEHCKKNDQNVETRVLSIAQDLVFTVNGEKKWTPKHIGLGASLHQATRSKKLVELFHSAGHTISYKDILRVDTALATHTLSSMDGETGAVIPPNLAEGRFIHFSADNIDINEGTLDGQKKFHATQIAAWQRGPEPVDILESIFPSKQTSLDVPEEMNTIFPSYVREGSAEPIFKQDVREEWFQQKVGDCRAAQRGIATDMVFHILRQNQDPKPGWTHFNEKHAKTDPEVTTVGYMPIILAPAHNLDTLNTVIKRIMQVANSFNQTHVVLTVDQALFPLLMELKWAVPEYKDVLIPRLGGLHISLNFLKALGQHMQNCGLAEIWIESGLLGPRTTERVLEGKDYSKGMRAHKITFQALWQLLLPHFLAYVEVRDQKLKENLDRCVQPSGKVDTGRMCDLLMSEDYNLIVLSFLKSKKEKDPLFRFWWQYMKMVQILLLFTRAQREGQWDLHLYAFQEMLPFFHRYDHTNYARWGPIYLAQMKQLPPEVQAEFENGNWVVKGSSRKFNQVDPDQALEWLNGTGKRGGGIVGITRTPSALFRWTLSYTFRGHIAAQTRKMFHLKYEDEMAYNESSPSRIRRDSSDEQKIMELFHQSKVFASILEGVVPLDILHNIVTKDVATEEIQKSLLNASTLGRENVTAFVKERLVLVAGEGFQTKKLRDPLHKNNALTFSSLYIAGKEEKDKSMSNAKAERNILQRIITAFDAGRQIDLKTILSHELLNVPVSLTDNNGFLRSGNKSILTQALCAGIHLPLVLPSPTGRSSTLVIDGQALVMSLGRPPDCNTFTEYADRFTKTVLTLGKDFNRIDVTFDRYREFSIKNATRKKRTKGLQCIRRAVTDGSVPLPKNWSSFITLNENKADLARFLSTALIAQSPVEKVVITGGGFTEENAVLSSSLDIDITALQGYHEEADTRIILHCVHSTADFLVVQDTDVFLLLVAHFDRMQCKQLWMKAGTSKKPKFLPIHTVHESLKLQIPDIDTILSFHALTGNDNNDIFITM